MLDFSDDERAVFADIAAAIRTQGYAILPQALPVAIADALWLHLKNLHAHQFSPAGIGRMDGFTLDRKIRSDEICWINGESSAGRLWLDWADRLKCYLNRALYLGLFSFESHFSHYGVGDFYQRHVDAFKGQSNRVLSLVVYLNRNWQQSDGGELVLYNQEQAVSVLPTFATIAIFLSEEFPHEVLPANRDRFAIAGWYRLNSSVTDRVDPPQ